MHRHSLHAAQFQLPHRGFQPLLQPLPAHLLEVAVDRVPRRHREFRKGIIDFAEFEMAALGKLHAAAHDLRRVREEPLHFCGALDEELVGIEFKTLRVVDRSERLHAQQHFMRMRVVLTQIMTVVRGNQRDVEVFLKTEQIGMNLLLEFQALILNFKEEVAASKDVLILAGGGLSGFVFTGHQVLAQLARKTARESDQSLRMLGKILLADARLSIETVE